MSFFDETFFLGEQQMSGTRFRRPPWFVPALLAGLTLVWLSEGLAYINGGDEKSSLNASITSLKKDGRGLALVSVSYNRFGTTQVPLSEKEQQAREEQVRVSVATTLKSLPAGTFSEEQQRAILQAARTEFTRWMNQKDPAEFQSELKQLTGDRDFRVGVFSYQKWYEYRMALSSVLRGIVSAERGCSWFGRCVFGPTR